MEAPAMANVSERQVSLRLPDDVVDRAEALAPVLGQLQAYRAFRVERATVFRLALIRGLEELERENNAPRYRPNVDTLTTDPVTGGRLVNGQPATQEHIDRTIARVMGGGVAEKLADVPHTPTRKRAKSRKP